MFESQEPPKTEVPNPEPPADFNPTWNDLTPDERKLLTMLRGDSIKAAVITLSHIREKERKPDESDEDYAYRTRFHPCVDEKLPYDLEAGLVYTTNTDDIPQELWNGFSGYAMVGNRTDNFCNAIAIHARLIQDWKLHINFADPQWAEKFKDITLAIQDVLNKAHG